MTDEPYLIAHKVRGEAAFDIAIKQECPICQGDGNLSDGVIGISGDDGMVRCDECDGEGFWWICSTSGHRARPFETWYLPDLRCPTFDGEDMEFPSKVELPKDFASWPDHYPAPSSPKSPSPLASILAAFKPKALDIKRRL